MPRKPPGDGKVIPIKAEDREPAQPRKRSARNGTRSNAAAINTAERRADAVQLRRAGLSFTRIAETLAGKYRQPGYDRASAYRDVRTALDRIIEEPARELKAEELDRLAALQSAHWSAAMKGDVPATVTILRIMQHRAKLVGLESPIKHDVSGTGAEVTINLADPAELQQAGLELLDALTAPTKRKPADKASNGP